MSGASHDRKQSTVRNRTTDNINGRINRRSTLRFTIRKFYIWTAFNNYTFIWRAPERQRTQLSFNPQLCGFVLMCSQVKHKAQSLTLVKEADEATNRWTSRGLFDPSLVVFDSTGAIVRNKRTVNDHRLTPHKRTDSKRSSANTNKAHRQLHYNKQYSSKATVLREIITSGRLPTKETANVHCIHW